MTKMLLATSVMTFLYLSKTANNPLKASLMILLFSSVSFLAAKIMTGTTWFPLILYMLFTGGILMTFMILSSVMPNEKTKKSKMPKFWILMIVACWYVSTLEYCPIKETMGEMKSSISSMIMFFFLTGIVMMYFLYSMSLNEKEMTPMRSI